MKKILFFAVLLIKSSLQAQISIETIYSCNNKSAAYIFTTSYLGAESQFKLLDKIFKIVVTSIKPVGQTKNKFVSFDCFEVTPDDQVLYGRSAITCFPLHSDRFAQIKLGNKGNEIEQSVIFNVKEVE